jgi:hypothetical protein
MDTEGGRFGCMRCHSEWRPGAAGAFELAETAQNAGQESKILGAVWETRRQQLALLVGAANKVDKGTHARSPRRYVSTASSRRG